MTLQLPRSYHNIILWTLQRSGDWLYYFLIMQFEMSTKTFNDSVYFKFNRTLFVTCSWWYPCTFYQTFSFLAWSLSKQSEYINNLVLHVPKFSLILHSLAQDFHWTSTWTCCSSRQLVVACKKNTHCCGMTSVDSWANHHGKIDTAFLQQSLATLQTRAFSFPF